MRKLRKQIQRFLMSLVVKIYPVEWQAEDMRKQIQEDIEMRKLMEKVIMLKLGRNPTTKEDHVTN